MNFGMMVYSYEWIIFYSLTAYLKGQGHRTKITLPSLRILFCLYLVDDYTYWNEFWYGNVKPRVEDFLLITFYLQGQGHRTKDQTESLEILFCLYLVDEYTYWNEFWYGNVEP